MDAIRIRERNNLINLNLTDKIKVMKNKNKLKMKIFVKVIIQDDLSKKDINREQHKGTH